MHSISPIGANLGGLNGKKMSEVGADCFFSSKTCVFMTVDFGFELFITLVHSKKSSYDLMLDAEDGS